MTAVGFQIKPFYSNNIYKPQFEIGGKKLHPILLNFTILVL